MKTMEPVQYKIMDTIGDAAPLYGTAEKICTIFKAWYTDGCELTPDVENMLDKFKDSLGFFSYDFDEEAASYLGLKIEEFQMI